MANLSIFKNLEFSLGPNVEDYLRISIAAELGISSPLNTSRYLGLPSLIGKSKKAFFGFLKERL